MSFWSKLGKIGLAAAPYVAAPFTGGASLMATGATNKALGKWNEHDAQKNAEKGIGPSKFDKFLGMGSNVAGMASGMGALGKGMTPSTSGGGGGFLGKLGGMFGGQGGSTPPFVGNGGMMDGGPGGWGGQGGNGGIGGNMNNIMDLLNQFKSRQQNTGVVGPQQPNAVGGPQQSGQGYGQGGMMNPNLGPSIFAGRRDAMQNQPFRQGGPIMGQNDQNQPVQTGTAPPIFPQFNPGQEWGRGGNGMGLQKQFPQFGGGGQQFMNDQGMNPGGDQMAKPAVQPRMGGMFSKPMQSQHRDPDFSGMY